MQDINAYIQKHKRNKPLWVKLNALLQYIIDEAYTDLTDVKSKFNDPTVLSEDTIKEIIRERGFDYIVSIMDTISGFEFNTMLSFVDLIDQLKGSRAGLELVLRLLGFDSLIREWWEDPNNLGDPLTYEIVVFVDGSLVPDLFTTIDKVEVFSENYVLGKISNIEIRFLFENFAERGAIMAGFARPSYFGHIIQRAY